MSVESPSQPVKKILVVDDDQIILLTLSMKLEAAGYQVFTALDRAQTIAAIHKENPDLVLLDICFPAAVDGVPWDGFRVMDLLHQSNPSKKIPIIIVTGSEDPKILEQAVTSEAVAVFQKPIDHDDLLKAVRLALVSS